MPQSALALGQRVGPFGDRLDADRLGAFAAATHDPWRRERDGDAVPACAVVTLLWQPQTAGRSHLIAQAFQEQAASGVHGEHEVRLHRPIEPGEPLFTWVEGVGVRPVGNNSVLTLRYPTFDGDEQLVAEQWWTTVWLGATCLPIGVSAPAHAFPAPARQRPVATWAIDVDSEMARQDALASGDWSPHHFELDAARRSGADRPFLHGLCTMALCGRGAAERSADGAPAAVRRLAVRFARPMPLDTRLTVEFYDAGAGAYVVEATCGEEIVISNGRLELQVGS